jgi:hypothetical protein
LRSVLEVILKNLRRKGGVHLLSGGLYRPHNLSAANYFGRGKARDLGRQYQVDLQLHVGLEKIFRLEQQSGTADIPGFTVVPFLFVQ